MALCSAAVLFSASCKRELLSPVPETTVSIEFAFDSPFRIEAQALSLYGSLKSGNFYGGRYVVYGNLRGEDFINETSNLVTASDVWSMNLANSATSVKTAWAQGYLTINRCNLFARPYVDGNGNKPGLPLRLVGVTAQGSSDMARSTVDQIYTQILSDLNFAETNLPLTNTGNFNVTRAHRNTAIALKTRVYLSMGKYPEVIAEANKIVPAVAPFKATSGVPNDLQADITTVFK
eukprot:gene18802-22397_t